MARGSLAGFVTSVSGWASNQVRASSTKTGVSAGRGFRIARRKRACPAELVETIVVPVVISEAKRNFKIASASPSGRRGCFPARPNDAAQERNAADVHPVKRERQG